MVICPIHGNGDTVQSIPALVLAENFDATLSGAYSGITYYDGSPAYTSGYSTNHGTLTSVIGQKLAAPPSPFLLDFWSLVSWSFGFLFSVYPDGP